MKVEPEVNADISKNNKVLKDNLAQLYTLVHKDELQQVGMVPPYPFEWDVAPYPSQFETSLLYQDDERGS